MHLASDYIHSYRSSKEPKDTLLTLQGYTSCSSNRFFSSSTKSWRIFSL
jgi:hypothetical protein